MELEGTRGSASLKKIRNLTEEFNCHILLVHHSRKGDASGNDSAILGSTGLIGAVDLIIQLEMDPNGIRVLSSNGRSGRHFERVPLDFDENSMHFSSGKSYSTILQQNILDLIQRTPGISRDEIDKILNKKRANVTATLKTLLQQRLIELIKEGKKHTYFSKSDEETMEDEV